jgi:hypothetical protein
MIAAAAILPGADSTDGIRHASALRDSGNWDDAPKSNVTAVTSGQSEGVTDLLSFYRNTHTGNQLADFDQTEMVSRRISMPKGENDHACLTFCVSTSLQIIELAGRRLVKLGTRNRGGTAFFSRYVTMDQKRRKEI